MSSLPGKPVVTRHRLERYRQRRDFRRTGEPRGAGAKDSGDGPRFVIQEHAAQSRHFDFRLEVDGGLESWAVPKGPSTDPREKRLAVRTETHPREYADFEGVIPKGEYGAGGVIVWDTGRYENVSTDDDGNAMSMSEALAAGHAKVRLHGDKLRGGYALVHAKPGGDENAWLLVKTPDDDADARRNPVNTQPESVLSGRTVQQLTSEHEE